MSVLPGAAGVDTGDSGVREEEEGGERSEGNGAEERERSHGREEKRREEGNGSLGLKGMEKGREEGGVLMEGEGGRKGQRGNGNQNPNKQTHCTAKPIKQAPKLSLV